MVDGIKITNTGLSLKDLKNIDFLTVVGKYDSKTGEALKGNDYTKYHSLHFKESTEGVIGMRGSLHMYYNGGTHNFDNFTFSKLNSTINRLQNDFGIDPFKTVLNNIEFGVNIIIPFDVNRFIESLVVYKSDQFNLERKPGMLSATVKNSQYIVKIYNKGLQNNLPENLLRFEIKVVRMAKIDKYGISVLQDLTNYNKLCGVKELLLATFDSIIYCDEVIDTSNLSQTDAELIRNGSNHRFWSNHYKEAGSNASKKVRRYRKLINEHGTHGFHIIRDLISEKWDFLLNDKAQGRVFTDSQNRKMKKGVRVFTGLQKISEAEGVRVITESENHWENFGFGLSEIKSTSSYNLSIEKNLVSQKGEGSRCIVTGLDISMQKPVSRFLSIKGVRHIYYTDKGLYVKLLSEIPPRWQHETLERQFYGIAHHVRDLFFNKRNQPRRAIEKLCSQPALFNNWDLISERKKAIVSRP